MISVSRLFGGFAPALRLAGSFSLVEEQKHRSVCEKDDNSVLSLLCFLLSHTGTAKMQGAFEVESRQVLNDMPRARQEDRTEAYEEKQLAPETGKQVCPDAGKQIFADDVGLEASANEDQSAPYADNDHNAAIRPSRKIRVVLCGILALIIILAIILGLALGLKHNSSEKEPLTNSTTSSSTSLPSSPTTILNKPFQRNVAALSFASNDISSQLVNITHVYFQDNLGRLLEASGSADNASWVISATPMTAKNGSAIAAAVSRPGFPQVG